MYWHCRETIIALKARSKAFRIALEFLNPPVDLVKPNDLRCECGGELRLVDEDHGVLQCVKCQNSIRVAAAEPEPDLWIGYPLRRPRLFQRAVAWALLSVFVIAIIAACVYIFSHTPPAAPDAEPTTAPADVSARN